MIYIFPLSFIKLCTTTNQHRKLENLYMGVSVSCSLLLQSWFKLLDCHWHCQRSCRTDTKLCTASFPCDGWSKYLDLTSIFCLPGSACFSIHQIMETSGVMSRWSYFYSLWFAQKNDMNFVVDWVYIFG